jgi:hypothetical protein
VYSITTKEIAFQVIKDMIKYVYTKDILCIYQDLKSGERERERAGHHASSTKKGPGE